MAQHAEPSLDEHLWTIAVARILFGAGDEHPGAAQSARRMRSQRLIAAGINDWGGVSPVTPDHVNPERPWPRSTRWRAKRRRPARSWSSGLRSIRTIVEQKDRWLDRTLQARVLRMSDAEGFARVEAWTPGADRLAAADAGRSDRRAGLLTADSRPRRERSGTRAKREIVALFAARGESFLEVCAAADALRAAIVRRAASATSSTATSTTPMSAPIAARSARSRRARRTKTCAGARTISPSRKSSAAPTRPGDAARPKSACRAASIRATPARPISRSAAPSSGRPPACTSTLSRRSKSGRARRRSVRACRIFSPAAGGGARLAARHGGGNPRRRGARGHLPRQGHDRAMARRDRGRASASACAPPRPSCSATSTRRAHWARHLLRIRGLQARTGGFTEFVPLPFVPMEAPM